MYAYLEVVDAVASDGVGDVGGTVAAGRVGGPEPEIQRQGLNEIILLN